MLIIKPYGRSETSFDQSGKLRRKIRREFNSMDIRKFAGNHPELVIAQWISMIDKIAAKPRSHGKPTAEQRKLRDVIGRAAWSHLEKNKNLLKGLDGGRRGHLEKLWKFKVAPYPKGDLRTDRKNGRNPSAKGKWYNRFVGKRSPGSIDPRSARNIVRKIEEHLNRGQYRICGDRPPKTAGHVDGRAGSISANVAKPQKSPPGRQWSDADINLYFSAGDVAEKIKRAARTRESGEDGAATRRVGTDVAAKELYDHWAGIFTGKDGSALSIAEARAEMPGMFSLHCAVRDAYSRILKRHRKGRRKKESGGEDRISRLLPADRDSLLKLLDSMGSNRDINRLIRLGKIIHYSASGKSADSPGNVIDNWPGELSASPYLTSGGQDEIKGNEAFVRIWRHVLALANQTLHHWADPDGSVSGDIFTGGAWGKAKSGFRTEHFQSKAKLLLGARSSLFTDEKDPSFEREVLDAARNHAAGLRNSSFHFKGLGGFLGTLDTDNGGPGGRVEEALRNLYESDLSDRTGRMVETMRGAHMDRFFEESLNRRFFSALSGAESGSLALPRFARVLRRHENAWQNGGHSFRLIQPANRNALQNPARLCAYTALKLLYERPFRRWLEGLDSGRLGGYIGVAEQRASEAARSRNSKGDEDRSAVIEARASKIARAAGNMTVNEFFFTLSAETASEMRVQRYYASDPDAARKQAEYIENLKCDVIALAFADYLEEDGFGSVLDLDEDKPLPDTQKFRLEDLSAVPAAPVSPSGWQLRLYFLLHLVPVDAVGRLLHQLRKWKNLSARLGKADGGKAEMERILLETLELHLDMHDAKFEGSEGIAGAEKLRCLFDDKAAFDRVFPARPGRDDSSLLPYRGLREILRFGGLKPLMPVFEKHPVTSADVNEVMKAEAEGDGGSLIARRQADREDLHAKWVRTKGRTGFSAADRDNYRKVLGEVIRHRHLSAHVRLVNHARLNGLLMRILGRLADYAGLWERDLYFATLALIRELRSLTPDKVFDEKGLECFRQGRIIEALRHLHQSETGLRDRLKELFRLDNRFLEGSADCVRIRNELMHFNMLRDSGISSGSGQGKLNLTRLANDTRMLMEYDRKLKNSVSRSVAEMVAKEGIDLTWEMPNHLLSSAKVKARQAAHLGNSGIREDIHGKKFVEMAADLFDGTVAIRNSISRGKKREQGTARKQRTRQKKRLNRN